MLFWIVGKSKFGNNCHSAPMQLSVSEREKWLLLSKKKVLLLSNNLWFIIMVYYEVAGNIYNDEGK